MKKFLTLVALTGLLSLNSCNTTIGFGRDLRQLGTGMENKAHGRTFSGEAQQQDDGSGGNLPAY